MNMNQDREDNTVKTVEQSKAYILRELFLSTFYLSAFTFGGGYVIVTLLKRKFVDELHWIDDEEMLDLVAIAQSSPGPIAINAATFVGLQVAGVPGAVFATLGDILPSCIFVTILAYFYTKYRHLTLMQGILKTLRPAVVSMIFVAGLIILIPALFQDGTLHFTNSNFQPFAGFLFLLALLLLRQKRYKKIGSISVMLLCGILEVIAESIY